MRLSKIKLAGFKSFVDPTTIYLPSNLIGVVGPNGCGKSNVIDAVRWVMGESSAKNLRGDSMADVIFNGSSARKPVGTASIELVFDNSDGAIGGPYASYTEVSIRRQVGRDGTSLYFLNNARCRRKDITGIFLGTGLGPRSYAIIEQGMITRMIDAKPEELRVYIEEAAGISKYKERRRETENRIRHTRDNLERLADLRDEIEKLIKHLQRQARTAERYTTLKQESRQIGAELLALRLRDLDAQSKEKQTGLSEIENRLQSAIADQRSVETQIEKARQEYSDRTEAFNEVQGRYYKTGAEIARLEQAIQHGRELRQSREDDLKDVDESLEALNEHINKDQSEIEQLEQLLLELEPDFEQAKCEERDAINALRETEQAMHDWQARWESFSHASSETEKQTHVEQTRIEHLESELERLSTQKIKIAAEMEELDPETVETHLTALIKREEQARSKHTRLDEQMNLLVEQIQQLRDQDRKLSVHLDSCRDDMQKVRGKLQSLEALQQAALGQTEGDVTDWLVKKGLSDRPRLAQQLNVAAGWERAVETVLGDCLEAVCVEGTDAVEAVLGSLESGSVSFVQFDGSETSTDAESNMLLSRVVNGAGLETFFDGIHAANDLAAALHRLKTLTRGESVITKDGIWMGQGWFRVNRGAGERSGVISREEEMRQTREELDGHRKRVRDMEKVQHSTRVRLKELEDTRETGQKELNRLHKLHADLEAQMGSYKIRMAQTTRKVRELEDEASNIDRMLTQSHEQRSASNEKIDRGGKMLDEQLTTRENLEAERDLIRKNLDEARETAQAKLATAQDIAIRVESRRTSKESASTGLERMQAQMAQHSARRESLENQISESEAPLAEQHTELEGLLGQRVDVEAELSRARSNVEETESAQRELEQNRSEREAQVSEVREKKDAANMAAHEVKVRHEAIAEQFEETGFELDATFEGLAEDADITVWHENLDKLNRRIERLGAINLAAIDEFKEQSERKEYLDAQSDDLTEALETLENAIRKIDRETRTRFKETFDRVNDGLMKIFPRLFGGGHAYLELIGDDLLNSGVTIMARPPGKRNSTIHLLSGGEKALTAVALVFSIFELNPAPFCLLDEVDAPLDDANVGRFCEIVREMSSRVQFVIITHNKATMEMANQLTGVTMHEPGVSRLVAVDVDEAIQLAAS